MGKKLDLTEFYDGDLKLPWAYKDWVIKEPSAKESERLRALVFTQEMHGDTEVYEMRKLMGQTWNDLIDSGIGWSHLLHMGRTALIHFTTTPEVAEQFWHLAQAATLLDLDLLMKKE